MPIPTCQCSVCNQVVNKSTTYHVGNGKRACKSHQGVVEQASAIQQKAKDDAKAAEESKRRADEQRKKDRENQFKPDPSIAHWRDMECWTCGKEAFPLQFFYQRQLVAMEKQKQRGTGEYLKAALLGDKTAHEQNLKDMGFPVGTLFYREHELPIFSSQRDAILRDIKGGSVRKEVVRLIRSVHLCQDCCKKYGMEFFPPLPKLNMKTMMLLGSMELPSIKETARKEMEVEQSPDSLDDKGK